MKENINYNQENIITEINKRNMKVIEMKLKKVMKKKIF